MSRSPLTPDDPSKAPGHTCGTIDRVKTLVRRLARAADACDHDPDHHAQLLQEAHAELEQLRAANERLRSLAGEHRAAKRYRVVRSPRTWPSPTWNVLDTHEGALVRSGNGARVRGYSTEAAAQEKADRWSCVCCCAVQDKPRTRPAE